MKLLSSVCVIFLLLSCGQKSTPETGSPDTTKTESVTLGVPEQKDTLVEEPVATQTTPIETTQEKKETGPKPLLCKFQNLEGGECLRYVFDCASFGLEAISLPKEQADVWNNLMTFDGSHGDEPIANPAYVNKTFAILQTVMERDVCQSGTMVKQRVSTITSFKLVK